MNEWQSAEHALAYLQRADQVPHRAAGEAVLLEEVSPGASRVLDPGAGDVWLLALLLLAPPAAQGVALDFSPLMLGRRPRSLTLGRSTRSCRASPSTTWRTNGNGASTRRCGRSWSPGGCSAT